MSFVGRLITVTSTAVVVGVAAIAAKVSYTHALEVVRHFGETGLDAYLTPLTIDGGVYVASMTLLDAARHGVRAPRLAWFTLALGLTATLAVNVWHGARHGGGGAVVSGWPAVTLGCSTELLMWRLRRRAVAPNVEPVPQPEPEVREVPEPEPTVIEVPEAESVPVGEAVGVPARSASEERDVPAGEAEVPPKPEPDAPDAAKAPEPEPGEDLMSGLPTEWRVIYCEAAERFADRIERNQLPTIREIKKEMGVAQPKATAASKYVRRLADARLSGRSLEPAAS